MRAHSGASLNPNPPTYSQRLGVGRLPAARQSGFSASVQSGRAILTAAKAALYLVDLKPHCAFVTLCTLFSFIFPAYLSGWLAREGQQ